MDLPAPLKLDPLLAEIAFVWANINLLTLGIYQVLFGFLQRLLSFFFLGGGRGGFYEIMNYK